MRSFFFVLLYIVSVVTYSETTATIGGWNLAGNNVSRLQDDQLKLQAESISLFEPDLLVLSEVNPATAIFDIVKFLKTDHNLDYKARIINQEPRIDIGIIYKSEHQVNQFGVIPGSDLGNPRLRNSFWAAATIDKFDFLLIGVHFKSAGGSSNKATRELQLDIVVDFYENYVNTGTDKDVLVVGDYNMFPSRDRNGFKVLSNNGFLRFISTEELCSGQNNNTCKGTHIQGRRGSARIGNMLDGFGISKNETAEYKGDLERLDLHTNMTMSLRDFKNEVSDHLPIWATFRVDVDDD